MYVKCIWQSGRIQNNKELLQLNNKETQLKKK